jgi:catechol 2,3-dioxygenase-like lactoylglutathione lyase family enzyme
MSMQQRITLITLGVSDLERSRNFYEKTFGWRALPNSSDDIVFFQLNGMQLALFPSHALAEDAGVDHNGTGFRKFSLAINMRSEKEVDDFFGSLESKGAKVLKRPQKVFWGGYSSYVADPDDNLWEIAFNPFMTLDEKGNVQ